MRKLLIIFVVILQVILLAYMAGQRENVLRTGKTIYLRTVPIDPRDLFRGDYVRLQYEISNIE
ncbi:MAG: GDYXXLXY domain-containing protein, partial [Phycisphaerae bacterium]